MNNGVIHEELNAVPTKIVQDASEVPEDQEINELELMHEKQIDNLKYALKNMLKAFRNPREAKRARDYVERQAWQSLYHTIELIRGDNR